MDALKLKLAHAVLPYLEGYNILGIGTGSTINTLIPFLKSLSPHLDACVASSKATKILLEQQGIACLDLNTTGPIDLYVDGADEIDNNLCMLKGGGGALTTEKIVGFAAKKWICIAEERKLVEKLGKFPVVVEVLPMARSLVARHLLAMGGSAVYREKFKTDHNNIILDVYDLDLNNPALIEQEIKNIPGVVEVGICARRKADFAILAAVDKVFNISSMK